MNQYLVAFKIIVLLVLLPVWVMTGIFRIAVRGSDRIWDWIESETT